MPRMVVGALALLVGFSATDACAGRIFGDLKLDGKPVPAGVVVTVTVVSPPPAAGSPPPAAPPVAYSTTTDEFGGYKVTVKEEGKCVLTVVYDKKEATLVVFSNRTPTRYDLVLERKDNQLILKRK